ncbi:hypothetical protein [Dermabacter hominis]|uniref:FDXHR family putative zinc-binding protein n=1 Tax=Dermabacter hominis TaxID=36740 RepID=UPI00054F74F9
MDWSHCPECDSPLPNRQPYVHCAVCHRTFIGVTTWDAHRCDGQCLNPETEPAKRKWWQDANDCWHRGDRDPRFNRKAPK